MSVLQNIDESQADLKRPSQQGEEVVSSLLIPQGLLRCP